jgi:hypothetical protein
MKSTWNEKEEPFPWLTVSSWRRKIPSIFAAEDVVEQRKYEVHDVRGAKTSTMWIPTSRIRILALNFRHSASFPTFVWTSCRYLKDLPDWGGWDLP